MYFSIILIPLLSTFISGFGGRWLGRYGSSFFSSSFILLNFFLSLLIFFEVNICGSAVFLQLSPWFSSDILIVNWSFLFDSLTSVMLVVINSISSLVHFYSIGYLDEDPHFPRFMAYLSIFTFFMLMLVTADNLVQMFVGWEGVGIASYLLINFWFSRLSANQAALKALITNRVGDFGLSLAILLSFLVFGSLDYLTIFSLAPLFESYKISFFFFSFSFFSIFGLFLFFGAIGKSAQLGLHVWLPDAMEGPTPVSALIHAATMVTAGIFLLIRFSPILEFSSFTLALLILFGSATAFFAAFTGIFQSDLKKIIAYSTCSQLGYMMFSCGLSHYNLSLFHLTNHAFFKALLFLAAGSVIHAISDEQDIRRMGAFLPSLPLTYSVFMIGSLALAGFPFLTGFYSKDLILEICQVYRNRDLLYLGTTACVFGNLAVFFTTFYSFRLLFFTFFNPTNSPRSIYNLISESSIFIYLPLILLALGSIFIGYLGKDFFVGFGTPIWNSTLFIFSNNLYFVESEFLPPLLKWLPFLFSFTGFFFSFFLNTKNITLLFYKLAFFVNKKWYWDSFYSRFIVFPILNFGLVVTFKTLDRGFIELSGPYGFSKVVPVWASLINLLQSGQLSHYTFLFVLALILFFSSFYLTLTSLLFFLTLFFFI
uniref:NADH-ubiquinone oxidoreductase chain 5 n=1 Tax=Campylaephora sungminbooi TaxID=1896769 RepID=A0A1B0ZES0_9FLOR|nr:NADH dehydrogenase subunit 5 [Campylaephora sungminbooi]ANP26227.1 NADH dehydrogenase subunit 5 [Campylaephora sungminbooi]